MNKISERKANALNVLNPVLSTNQTPRFQALNQWVASFSGPLILTRMTIKMTTMKITTMAMTMTTMTVTMTTMTMTTMTMTMTTMTMTMTMLDYNDND